MNINDDLLKMVAEKSMQNAESLMSDADILKEAKRYQRAYALYQFSMEEVGKALSSVFLLVQIDPTTEEINEYKKGFRKHRHKLKKSGMLDMLICQILHKGNYEGAMSFLKSSISEDECILDEYKNKSLYTEVINNDVKIPSEMVGEKEMNYLRFRAITRYKMAETFVEVSLKHYDELREYQRENGSIRDKKLDTEKAAKEFWDNILSNDEAG